MHKFWMALTPCLGCPLCVGSNNHCPIPFPLPLFSPMGRLLSSWPAHGEKRGRGEGMGHWFSVCTGLFIWVGHCLCLCAQDSLPGFAPLQWLDSAQNFHGPHSLSVPNPDK